MRSVGNYEDQTISNEFRAGKFRHIFESQVQEKRFPVYIKHDQILRDQLESNNLRKFHMYMKNRVTAALAIKREKPLKICWVCTKIKHIC